MSLLRFITLWVNSAESGSDGARQLSLAYDGRTHYQEVHTLKLLGNIEHGDRVLPATERDRLALIAFLQRPEVIEKIATLKRGDG